MNPVVVNALVATTASEATKLATSIVEYKKATDAINAELVKVETMAKLEMERIKADTKQAKKQIKAQASSFRKQLKSFNKDKENLSEQLAFCVQQATNFSLTAEERQEARVMAQMLIAQMDNVRHDQLTSQAKFNDNIGRVERYQYSGTVVDGDFCER